MMSDLTHDLLQQRYHLIDGFLDHNIATTLYHFVHDLHQQGKLRPANIGQNATKTSSIRNDTLFWLDEPTENPALNVYFSTLHDLRQQLNQHFFLGLDQIEAHAAVYPPGHFYKKHVDQFLTNNDRRISCVYYLNPHWTQAMQGELILYDSEQAVLRAIEPQHNRFICFESDLLHEVKPTNQTRYSLAAWLKVRRLD